MAGKDQRSAFVPVASAVHHVAYVTVDFAYFPLAKFKPKKT
jgi:hypothetical protein